MSISERTESCRAMLTGCTIVAGNYLAHARVLAESFERWHPGARFVVLVVDDDDVDERNEPFEQWGLHDLGIEASELRVMAAIYTVMEFCTAVKPWLLRALSVKFSEGPVVYLDPDIEVHAALDEIVAPAIDEAMVLTPHVLQPMPRDGRRPNEADILGSGVYNLGFIAIGPGATDSGFLEFWSDRLRRDAIVDHEHMLFTDQRWVDFVAMYPHATCRDPGCNVAYWNLWARPCSHDAEGGYRAAGRPLKFFHFSGFDPATPHVLSKHQGADPRIRLPDHPVIAELCANYARRLVDAGHTAETQRAYGWGTTASGVRLTRSMRRAYRRALLEAESGNDVLPPGPFDPDGGEAFVEWLTEPVREAAVSNLLRGRWEQEAGLRALFPDPLGPNARPYVDFARVHRGADIAPSDVYDRALNTPVRSESECPLECGAAPTGHGVNLYGYFASTLSVGQVARSFSRALTAVDVPLQRVNDPAGLGGVSDDAFGTTGGWSYDVNLLCVNADRTRQAIDRLGPDAFSGRHTAALWAWETSVLPEDAVNTMALVDEIWVSSTYIADAVRGAGRTPRMVTQPVEVPTWTTARKRSDLGLPDGFVVLSSFDWASVAERKNPHAVLDAYTRAFGPTDGTSLVFKTMNGDRGWADLDALRLAIADRPDIKIIDRCVSSAEMTAYLQLCDCFISLHRSEGFGLLMAEAMGCAKPCIATGYSGNLDFMDDRVSHLVPADVVAIPENVPVYGGYGEWADPDIDVAADHLVRVREDPRGSHRLGVLARESILANRNLFVAGRSIAQAAAALRAEGGDR